MFHDAILVYSFFVSDPGFTLIDSTSSPMLLKFAGILIASLNETIARPDGEIDLIFTTNPLAIIDTFYFCLV